jgi:predicted Zn finger-like uncharacterized protein
MILTCPACDTKYVVKDDAIPPGGRQVRCASCKHSWHQDPEISVAEPATAADIDFGGPPPPSPESFEEPAAETPQAAEAEDMVAEEPQPNVDDGGQSAWGEVADEPVTDQPMAEPPITNDSADVAMEEAPAIADEWRAPAPVAAVAEEVEFVGYAPIADEDDVPRRRWPLILGLLVLIVAAAAAFWFLAPPEWQARAGIAQAGATPLELTIESQDLQQLNSGNQLLTIRGRVINPTDKAQSVPPIRAEIRDRQTGTVIHRWTIGAPARVLAPGTSASFYSAGVDIPQGSEGELITVTLGG